MRRFLARFDIDDARWLILGVLVLGLFAQRAALEQLEGELQVLRLDQGLEGQRGDALTARTDALVERACEDELDTLEMGAEMDCARARLLELEAEPRLALDPVWDAQLAGCRVLVLEQAQ